MKAILCERWAHYSELKMRDVPRPALARGRVRIAVKYATAGFGVTLVVAGKYQRKPPLPFVPGTEIAGVVTEVADDVSGFKPGDRVVAALDWGGYADEAIATASTTWHVPDGIELAAAVNVPLSFGTSYAALHWRARIKPGETVVVFGAAGGVGLTAVQVACQAGAHVIAVAGSQQRVDLAIARGAHQGIVHGGDDLGKRIKAMNGGRTVDIVYDPVGGALFDQALHCVGAEGRVLVIGFASGEIPKIPANILLVKNIEIIGFNFGYYIGWGLTDEREVYADRLSDMVGRLFGHIERGELRALDSSIFPLEKFADAFDSVTGRRSVGRAVLQIAAESARDRTAGTSA